MRPLRNWLGVAIGVTGVSAVLLIAFFIASKTASGPGGLGLVIDPPAPTTSIDSSSQALVPIPSPSPSPSPRSAALPIPRIPRPKPLPPKPKPNPPPAGSVLIAAAGDVACDPDSGDFNNGTGTSTSCRQRYTSDLLLARSYAAVLALGDLQYDNGAFAKFMTSYDDSWGRVKSKTYPVPGNHEYDTSGAAGYFQYFGSRAGSSSKGYYSFNLGSWHMIALNSNCGAAGGCGEGSAQVQWLKVDLASHSNACTLAFWHHPRFSSGNHGSDSTYDAFFRALYDGGADVVLNGHDHLYERFAPQSPSGAADSARGIREFVVGTGGKDLVGFSSVKANSQVRNAKTFGILEMTLRPSGYDWRFVPQVGQTFSDSGSDSCH